MPGLALALAAWLGCAGVAAAQSRLAQSPAETYTYDQRLNQQVPLDLPVTDEQGHSVALGTYFGQRPVILVLVQYKCPKLCGIVLEGVVECLRQMPEQPGVAFEVVTVSFDPRERTMTEDDAELGRVSLARAKKQRFIESYGRPGAAGHWHWLTAEQEAIARLTDAVGFRYAYSEKDNRFAHGSGLVILTPGGRTSRYFYGIDFKPEEVREALRTAADNRIGRPLKGFERVLLLCYDEDAATGALSLNIMKAMRTAAAVTVVILGVYLFFVWRRARRDASVPPSPLVGEGPGVRGELAGTGGFAPHPLPLSPEGRGEKVQDAPRSPAAIREGN